MYKVCKIALESSADPPVGILTAGHRDNWHNAYKLLQPLNVGTLETINSAIFVACLDDFSAPNLNAHLQFMHNFDAHNRWFDKLQLIVKSSGRAGMNAEHSPCDAVAPGNMIDFILTSKPTTGPNVPLPEPEKLTWNVNPEILSHVHTAASQAKKLITETSSCLLHSNVYGTRYIKEVGIAL